MSKIISILAYPLFLLMWSIGNNKDKFRHDIESWCRWQGIEFSSFVACRFFVEDKAFRNLAYHRLGRSRVLLSWIFKGYDHLQITTPNSQLGGGLILQHGFSTIVSAKRIGKNCKIYQQVTIGYNHRLEAPILGNNVEVCSGAKIIGGVTIGDNVIIGANAVVTHDIPSNSVVAGIPAKVIGILKTMDIFSRT